MKVDSVVVYRSFVNALRKIKDPAERCKAYDAMFDYGLDHIETDLDDGAGIALELIKPLLDQQYQKKMVNKSNGMRGGRPRGEAVISDGELDVKTENNPKETENNRSKTEKNRKKANHNPNDNVNDNENVNGNGIEEEIDKEEVPKCSEAFTQALKDFSDMRKKIKKPLTDRAKQMILNKLSKLSTDEQEQIEILNQSILHSWQDVYPLKGGGQRYEKTNAFEELAKV